MRPARQTILAAAAACCAALMLRGGAVAAPRDAYTRHLPDRPASLAAWQARARALREQVRFSLGLWPEPPRTPLHPRITGRTAGDGFVVENVAIETMPGLYLCGNLYRPTSGRGPFPAIVNPHGHWQDGRLHRAEDVPRPEPGGARAQGRADFVALGANLARQGFVVFAYDMVGYGDTMQLGKHGAFAWSLQSWLWNVSLAGLQAWNGIRATDYVASLPFVDRRRIGATGASGGGTQTFLLSALDDRIRCAAPVNMVSSVMQGDCECEGAPGLRIGTDNVEIAALMAPRPLLLVAATGDWTVHTPTDEGPAVRAVYDLFGAGDRTAWRQFNYRHNFNVESREAVYAWFARWLQGAPAGAAVRESPVSIDVARMHVWDARHRLPAGALTPAQALEALEAIPEAHLRDLAPRDAPGLRRFRAEVGPRLAMSLSVDAPQSVRRGRASGPPSVLLVSAPDAAESADRLLGALRVRGCAVRELRLPAVEMNAAGLWNRFFCTYNRTPAGDRVQAICAALAEQRAAVGGPTAVAGVGAAGPWTLLAAALTPGADRVFADTCGLDEGADDAYAPGLWAPGLRRAGGIRSAAILTAPAGLLLANTGRLIDTDAIAACYRGPAAPAPRFERGSVDHGLLAAWLAGR